MILATPIFLQNLGAKQYGVWMLINSLVNNLGLLNVGIGGALVHFIAKYRGSNDLKNIKLIIETGINFTLIVFIIISIISFLIYLLPEAWFIFTGYEDLVGINVLLAISSLTFGFKIIEQVFVAVFQGFEQYNISSKFQMFSRSVSILGSVCVVFFGGDLTQVFLIMLLSAAFAAIIELSYLKNSKRIKLSFKLEKQKIKELFVYGKWVWGQSVLGIVNSQVDKYIVTFLAGVEFLAYYSIGLLVANQFQAIMSASANWVFPLISRAKSSFKSLEVKYYKLQSSVIAFGIFAISTVLVLSDWIFLFWLGAENYNHTKNIIELFLYLSLLSITSIIPYLYLNGKGYVKLNTKLMALGTSSTVVSMFIFEHLFGYEGLILGRIFTIGVVGVLSRTILHRKLFKDFRLYTGVVIILPSLLVILAFVLSPNGIYLSISIIILGLVILYKFIFNRAMSRG